MDECEKGKAEKDGKISMEYKVSVSEEDFLNFQRTSPYYKAVVSGEIVISDAQVAGAIQKAMAVCAVNSDQNAKILRHRLACVTEELKEQRELARDNSDEARDYMEDIKRVKNDNRDLLNQVAKLEAKVKRIHPKMRKK